MTRRRLAVLVAVMLAGALAIVVPSVMKTSAQSREQTLWSTTVPRSADSGDNRGVEVGLRFTASQDGDVLGLRFYRAAANTGTHTGYLRSAAGAVLAQVVVGSQAPGWQDVRFTEPVAIKGATEYIVSYTAPNGHYSGDNEFFASPLRVGTLTGLNGVYRYYAELPFSTYRFTNYYVDPIFVPGSGNPPAQSGEPATPAPTVTTTPSPTAPAQLTLREVDGGTKYYDRFSNGLPTSSSFFPRGIWYEGVEEAAQAARDKAAGINLYVELTSNSDLDLVSEAGMYAIPSFGFGKPGVAGYLLADEADMWAGPGEDPWTGKYPGEGDICEPSTGRCGYSVMEKVNKSAPVRAMTYANYGKGVSFWESDTEAARFVNDYQDVTSVDTYWFTDPSICAATQAGLMLGDGHSDIPAAQCRLAANYGRSVARVRSLMDPAHSKPVWAFVELGHPATEDDAPSITAPQVRAAVWSSLINGARGIVYFNHSFGGSCQSQHVLRDECGADVRPTVTAVNKQIDDLAGPLNAPFVDGLLTAPHSVDAAVKVYDGSFYLMTGSKQAASQKATLALSCVTDAEAEVLGENRKVDVRGGQLTDTFADGNAVHLYRVPVPQTCALPAGSR